MSSYIIPDFSDKKTLEKYSSAFTLSDMEIFIFPELFYPLVLANIMSPLIWKWRDDPWFNDIEKKNFNSRANRIKQYIIQNYVFNLDLSTWGLTTKTDEIARFSNFFDVGLLRQSNALFGYEGDKYYFDIDIRKHFGLDKFDSDIIPYWKTETVEAMTAFRYKEGFTTGAGECVSLSALYAAAMFIVGRVPLEKIFLIATPLHSQNFITEKEGLITNNRRIVTKNMWFNGTSLSEKARRALENEKVTIVSHISGFIHLLYNEASIDRNAYIAFTQKLNEFLTAEVTTQIFINFLRFKSKYKSLFQFRCDCSGKYRYISLEKMFEYEHTSKFNVSDGTRESLVKEIEGDEFHLSPLQGKLYLNDVEEIIDAQKGKNIDVIKNEVIRASDTAFSQVLSELFTELNDFIFTDPKLPESEKKYIDTYKHAISISDSREMILDKVAGSTGLSELSLLTQYVYRDMEKIDWRPFIKAAIERNPVCFNDLSGKSISQIYEILKDLPDESIYDDNRLALPDEVWNFKRGDGIEKAFLLADTIVKADRSASIMIKINNDSVMLEVGDQKYHFRSGKRFSKTITFKNGEIYVL
jgi:hypothetical protein